MMRLLTLVLTLSAVYGFTPSMPQPRNAPRAAISAATAVQGDAVEKIDGLWFKLDARPENEPALSCYQTNDGTWMCAYDYMFRYSSEDSY
eukprot:5232276-Prymnesium_polylepis.3